MHGMILSCVIHRPFLIMFDIIYKTWNVFWGRFIVRETGDGENWQNILID